MSSSAISRRYAEALLMIGIERNSLDQYVKELEILQKYLDQDKDIIEAEVRSVIPLTAKDYQVLERKLSKTTGKKVRLNNIIDPGLIGGIVIRIGDNILDGSVNKKLSLLTSWIRQSDYDQTLRLNKTFAKETEVKKLMDDPQALFIEKKKVLDKIIQEGISPIVANFLYLILDKNRELFYADIIRDFKKYVDEAKNIVNAEVCSARELSTEEIQALEGRLSRTTGKNVRVEVQIDSSLIGGMLIKVGDTLIDGTVKKKLSLLKQGLSSGSLKY